MENPSFKNNPKAVLVGNGIHRAYPENAVSWEELLNSLKTSERVLEKMPGVANVVLTNPLKPFPFAFEELLFNGSNFQDDNVRILKKEITRIFLGQIEAGKRSFNDLHIKLVDSGIDDIITTNYDYGFELCKIDSFMANTLRKKSLSLNNIERTKNIFRGYRIINNNKYVNIWHIHGELFDSRNNEDSITEYSEQSILIGYSDYRKHVTNIDDFYSGKAKGYLNMLQRLLLESKMGDSWIDKFFTHDLAIIGISLGFEELDLWWLLNTRSLLHKSGPKRYAEMNRIYFYMNKYVPVQHDDENQWFRDRVNWYKNNALKEVLASMHVEVKELESTSWPEFYTNAIDDFILI